MFTVDTKIENLTITVINEFICYITFRVIMTRHLPKQYMVRHC